MENEPQGTFANDKEDLAGGRVPPHSTEAERAVLGGVMLRDREIHQVIPILSPDHFYVRANAMIYEAMVELAQKNQPIDFVWLKDQLLRKGHLESVGGLEYLAELSNTVATAGNIVSYAGIIKEKAFLRQMIDAGLQLVAQGFDEPEDTQKYIREGLDRLFAINLEGDDRPYYHIADGMEDAFNAIALPNEDRRQIPTGFYDLDEKITGFAPGQLIILAARPAMGKTSLALNIATKIAQKEKRVAIFSLEMTRKELTSRMLCTEAEVDGTKARKGMPSTDELTRLGQAADELSQLPILIDDTGGISDSEIRAKAQLMESNGGLDLVVIDYLQLMQTRMQSRNFNREQYISQISRNLKNLAKDLDVPVLCLAQLSRAVESRPNKRPMMSDLRESGAIEQDADLVLFIYREEYYDPTRVDYHNVAELIVGKNRFGSTGRVAVRFEGSLTRFDNLAPDEMPEDFGQEGAAS